MRREMELELENYVQSAPTNKRFVVEDSFTKVTSDGEPHCMMTMVAGLAGLLAAVIILAVLVSMVACRKQKKQCSNSTTDREQDVAMKGVPQISTLAGNLNAAFAESTLSLSGTCKATDDCRQGQGQGQQQETWPTAVVVQRY
ncbi:uncharacterized protein LOC115627055 [Scaptodrosophila lebanonensis]|uniref:Uncharacterized protein LOC115627055 n=1 Tax=Drosophila lebanonensis TaxID=7225 RepID=A0A6J2TTI5_DROLE|nr:uncharacterized protein LOC115627055 [Scaptodrosophila lebanonensis]XP_030378459.1 uncharacterized protein LOC115627055 [Scaptodrosophila lebanonensis]XP_030378460.1 uncharacterized protein LOC115627055 [Scaptodrosophila lebanonensis]